MKRDDVFARWMRGSSPRMTVSGQREKVPEGGAEGHGADCCGGGWVAGQGA